MHGINIEFRCNLLIADPLAALLPLIQFDRRTAAGPVFFCCIEKVMQIHSNKRALEAACSEKLSTVQRAKIV
jgi:hypothetical protein